MSKWSALLAFSRKMPGIPGRGDPTACRTPGSGWAPRRRRPSGDNWAAGNLWAGAQLWRPLLFQSGARESVSGLSGMSGEAPPPPTLREERQIRNRDQGKTSGAPPLRVGRGASALGAASWQWPGPRALRAASVSAGPVSLGALCHSHNAPPSFSFSGFFLPPFYPDLFPLT